MLFLSNNYYSYFTDKNSIYFFFTFKRTSLAYMHSNQSYQMKVQYLPPKCAGVNVSNLNRQK